MEYLTWKAIKAFLAGIPSWVWGLLFVFALQFALYSFAFNRGEAKATAELAAYKAEVQKAVAIRLTQNKLKEAEDKRVFAEIANKYKQDKLDAKAKSDAVVAGLRAGTLKLRKQWQGCSVPTKAADGSSGVDEDSRLREESAGRIIGNAAEADSWILRLQEVIRQLQKEQ